MMKTKLQDGFPLDQVASRLAGEAGQTWNKMSDFPGYNRKLWRDEARIHVGKHDPEARIECLPSSWDGREGLCFIHHPAKG